LIIFHTDGEQTTANDGDEQHGKDAEQKFLAALHGVASGRVPLISKEALLSLSIFGVDASH